MTNAVLHALIQRVKAEAAAHDHANRSGTEAFEDGDKLQYTGVVAGSYMMDLTGESIVDQLLMAEPGEFVDAVYRLLLRREADDVGRANYDAQLASGTGRLVLAAKIRLSGEGRRIGVPLTGLRTAIVLAAAHKVMGRIGLSKLASCVQRYLDAAGEKRAFKRTLVSWRRRVAGSAQQHEARLGELSQSLQRLQRMMKPVPPVPPEVIDEYYLAFENANRGSRQSVLDKLRIYEHWLAYSVPIQPGLKYEIVDIGCGRGEWLQFITGKGKAAIGVDANPVMVAACEASGYNARHVDALTFLRSLPSGSVAAVTGFHIIEHLPFDYLFAIVEECFRVLVEGGSVLFETPNPENVLVGSHTFYHDFTHRNPVTPTAVSFLLKHHGFEAIDIIRSSPYPDEARVPGDDPLTARVNGHLCGPQDYAVIGTRRRAATGERA
ncbi:MAG: class I SAM-dependent methyltransferase [Paraburkholderia sp.]|uniref:class I SAM-dependent methyltransferase n=1 Tax=Paraburkholderia sp. TaxID=1926495 RepID=UPI003C3DA7A1